MPLRITFATTFAGSLVALTLLSSPARPASAGSFLGDTNCDGRTNSIDAAVVLQFDAGLLAALPCTNGDVNHDGTVNSVDAALILQLTAGLVEHLGPPCEHPGLSAAARSALPGLADAEGRIAYLCQGLVWTMRPDGSEQQLVTDPVAIDWERVHLNRVPEDQPPTPNEIRRLEDVMNSWPKWLPDGRIVFASIRDTLRRSAASPPSDPLPFVGASELYRANSNGAGLVRLTDYNLVPGSYPLGDFEPAQCLFPDFCFAGLLVVMPQAVSPDGDQVSLGVTEIRFSECCFFSALFTFATEALQRVTITAGQPEGGGSYALSWAPDGNRAVVFLFRGSPLGGPYVEELAVRDLAGDTSLIRAGEGEALEGNLGIPAWSPVDDRIAFCGWAGPGEPVTLYVIDAGGGDPQTVASLPAPADGLFFLRCVPSWSPDGQFITVGSSDGEVVMVHAGSGISAPIALGGQPNWSAGP